MKCMGLSFTMKNLVLSRKPGIVEIIDPLVLSRSSIYKLAAGSNILIFDWIRRSKNGNFFVVSSTGLHVLLIDETSLQVKKKDVFSAQIANAWFDSVRQFLALNFVDSPKELKVYDLNKVDDGISLKQPIYNLNLNLGDTDERMPVFNSNSYYERTKKTEETNHSNVIDFINLYNECYILHINSELGDLSLHEIGGIGFKSVKILAESSRLSCRQVPLQHHRQPARRALPLRADHLRNRRSPRHRHQHHLRRATLYEVQSRRHLPGRAAALHEAHRRRADQSSRRFTSSSNSEQK